MRKKNAFKPLTFDSELKRAFTTNKQKQTTRRSSPSSLSPSIIISPSIDSSFSVLLLLLPLYFLFLLRNPGKTDPFSPSRYPTLSRTPKEKREKKRKKSNGDRLILSTSNDSPIHQPTPYNAHHTHKQFKAIRSRPSPSSLLLKPYFPTWNSRKRLFRSNCPLFSPIRMDPFDTNFEIEITIQFVSTRTWTRTGKEREGREGGSRSIFHKHNNRGGRMRYCGNCYLLAFWPTTLGTVPVLYS